MPFSDHYPQFTPEKVGDLPDVGLLRLLPLIEIDIRAHIRGEDRPVDIEALHGQAIDYDLVLSELRKRGMREDGERAVRKLEGHVRNILAVAEEFTE